MRCLLVSNRICASAADLVMVPLGVNVLEVSHASRVLRLDKSADQCLTRISLMEVSFLRRSASLTVNDCLHRVLVWAAPRYDLSFRCWLQDTLRAILLVVATGLRVGRRIMKSTLVAGG